MTTRVKVELNQKKSTCRERSRKKSFLSFPLSLKLQDAENLHDFIRVISTNYVYTSMLNLLS